MFIVVLIAAGTWSCGGKGGGKGRKDPFHQYQIALDDLVDGDYAQAATMFEELASTTLNPVLAQLANLRLGDALYFQGRFAESAEVFREFLEQFPNSPDAPHAAYMRGLCFLRRMPDDIWLLPPAESRETADVESAYQTLTGLVEGYPDSFYAMRARLLLGQTLERKCRHHMYVADYYGRERKPLGIVQRIEQAIALESMERERGFLPQDYRCAETPRVLLRLGRAYYQTGNAKGVERTLERLKGQPAGRGADEEAELESLLGKLQTK